MLPTNTKVVYAVTSVIRVSTSTHSAITGDWEIDLFIDTLNYENYKLNQSKTCRHITILGLQGGKKCVSKSYKKHL